MNWWFAESAEELRKKINRAAVSAQKLAERADEGFHDISGSLRESASNLAEQGEAARLAVASKVAAATVPLFNPPVSTEVSHEVLAKRFAAEASDVVAATKCLCVDGSGEKLDEQHIMAAERTISTTLQGWLECLVAEATVNIAAHPSRDLSCAGPRLHALLQSHALQVVLEAMATNMSCRRTLKHAAQLLRGMNSISTQLKDVSSVQGQPARASESSEWTIVPDVDSLGGIDASDAPDAAETDNERPQEDVVADALANLLQKASPTLADPRLADLLDLLVAAGETCCLAAEEGDSVGTRHDLDWVVSILASALMDPLEVEGRSSAELCQAVHVTVSTLGPATAGASSSSSSTAPLDAPISPSHMAPIGEGWACWPPEGVWYRAKSKGWTSNKLVQVVWLRVPTHLIGTSCEDQYLRAQGRDDMLFTELGSSAVVAGESGRPPPVCIDPSNVNNDHEEDDWVDELRQAEEQSHAFTSLQALCRTLQLNRISPIAQNSEARDASSASPQTLSGVAEQLRLRRKTESERTGVLEKRIQESAEESQHWQEQAQKCTATMSVELEAMESERCNLVRHADALRSRREEVLAELQRVNEEIGDAETSLQSLHSKELRLRSSMNRVSQELTQQLLASEERRRIAACQKSLVEEASQVCALVEEDMCWRATKAEEVAGSSEQLSRDQEMVTQRCLESDMNRLVLLEALARAWKEQIWGPKAVLLVQDSVRSAALRSIHIRARGSIERLLIEAEDLLAQVGGTAAIEGLLGLDGALGLNGTLSATALNHASMLGTRLGSAGAMGAVSWQIARSLPRYRALQQQLVANLDRLCELEAATPTEACNSATGEAGGI
mmetsp:Transcript_16127/g.37043  ORF Transcript_16127/g.37043 Transcript_16127/m.37043 type:complete len:844 (-) Transcript_16127:50-2581(-)